MRRAKLVNAMEYRAQLVEKLEKANAKIERARKRLAKAEKAAVRERPNLHTDTLEALTTARSEHRLAERGVFDARERLRLFDDDCRR